MKAIGIISIIVGGISALQSLLSLFVIAIEDMIFTKMPQSIFNNQEIPFNFPEYIHNIATHIYIFMPIQIILGVIFIFAGIKLINKKPDSIMHIRFASLFQIVWYIAYSIAFYNVFMSLFSTLNTPFPTSGFFDFIYFISIFVGAIFVCAFPVFNLIYFRKYQWSNNVKI